MSRGRPGGILLPPADPPLTEYQNITEYTEYQNTEYQGFGRDPGGILVESQLNPCVNGIPEY